MSDKRKAAKEFTTMKTATNIFLLLSFQSGSPFAPSHHYAFRRTLARDANDRWRRHVLQEPETLITKDTVQLEEETILKDPNALVIGIDAAPVLYTTLSSHKPVSRELRVVVPKLSTVVLGEKIDTNDEYRRGLLIIGFITLLFSSNSPALHVAFTETGAPPVLLLNAAVSVVALVGLVFGGPILEATTPLPSALLRNQDKGSSNHNSVLSKDQIAGLELGLWKFLGTTANLFGLSLTTASHGAFLIQLTTLIVPVVQGMMGVPIPRRVQFSVALALAGVAMFTQDVGSVDLSSMPNVALGDALCVVAAGFYATYDLRLFQYGKQIKARSLITNKIATQAILSILLLLIAGREETMQFLSSTSIFSDSNTILALVILWSGIAVNAVAPFLQVGGQQAVGATRAQTIYASQPLWAAMLSCILLGETVGLQGMIGGSAFLAALFLAATAEAPEPDCGKENCEV
jgi:drug/metabolite transporter (DMT)-like permease